MREQRPIHRTVIAIFMLAIATAGPATMASGAETQTPSIPGLTFTANQLTEFEKRAGSGDLLAMRTLGLYHSGHADPSDSVSRDLDEAIRWYERLAETGDAPAMTSLGRIYQTLRMDYAIAAAWWRRAADKGDTVAMSALSRLYAQGHGVPRDAAQSFEWAEKAAQGGDGLAAYELAEMHLSGNGTQQDPIAAVYWYRKAAADEIRPAMIRLAVMYANGLGITQDHKQSFEWTQMAAADGSPIAMYALGVAYQTGTGIERNLAEARRWYEAAANAGEAEGMFGLSHLYDHGEGVAANPGIAADWMIQAIRHMSYQAAESIINAPQNWSTAFRREIQKRLRDAGVYTGRIDGNIGPQSKRAIAALAGFAQ